VTRGQVIEERSVEVPSFFGAQKRPKPWPRGAHARKGRLRVRLSAPDRTERRYARSGIDVDERWRCCLRRYSPGLTAIKDEQRSRGDPEKTEEGLHVEAYDRSGNSGEPFPGDTAAIDLTCGLP